jgi:hypothetical protein
MERCIVFKYACMGSDLDKSAFAHEREENPRLTKDYFVEIATALYRARNSRNILLFVLLCHAEVLGSFLGDRAEQICPYGLY